MEITSAIKRVIATGKIEYGTKSTIENIMNGKAKAIILAKNTPKSIKEDIETHAKNAEIPIIIYDGTSLSMGEVCGKPFVITSMTVISTGDVKLKELTEEKQ